MKRMFFACLVALAMRGDLLAGEAYALRFFTLSSQDGCARVLWQDDLVFHNPTPETATVRLLGVSNGSPPATPLTLEVPAGRTVSTTGRVNWFPNPTSPIWMVHLSFPDELVVQSRADVFSTSCLGGAPPSPVPDLGMFPLPIFRSLVPANVPKIHLGADLGAVNSRTNVGVYNPGDQGATALIEIRQACDDSVIATRSFSVPPNTVVQAVGLGGPAQGCGLFTPAQEWIRYVTVRVDQPSISFIVNRITELPVTPAVPYLAPFSQ